MKILGIVGSNARHSYNRLLLEFMKNKVISGYEVELAEIRGIPLFKEKQTPVPAVMELAEKIAAADAVIIACPEYNHSLPAALKSVLEWLSYVAHPFANKPVMLVGASTQPTGTSRGQTHLQTVLSSPGLHALVWHGNEFFLGNAATAFDDQGNIKNPATVKFLGQCFDQFTDFIGRLGQAGKGND